TGELEDGLGLVSREWHRERPRPRPRRRIVHGHRPLDGVIRRRREALDQTERRGVGIAIRASILVVGRLDDERVAVPVATGITHLELERSRRVRTTIRWDHADVVTQLVANRDESGRLHDLIRVAVDVRHHRAWYPARDAAFPQIEVLDAVERAIAALGVEA